MTAKAFTNLQKVATQLACIRETMKVGKILPCMFVLIHSHYQKLNLNPLEKELSDIDGNNPFEVKVVDVESAWKIIQLCMAAYKCFKVEIVNALVHHRSKGLSLA